MEVPLVSMLLERAVQTQFFISVTMHCKLLPHQSDYRQFISIETVVLNVVELNSSPAAIFFAKRFLPCSQMGILGGLRL